MGVLAGAWNRPPGGGDEPEGGPVPLQSATAEEIQAAVAAMRSALSAKQWHPAKIDRVVNVTCGPGLRLMGLDEVGTPSLFEDPD